MEDSPKDFADKDARPPRESYTLRDLDQVKLLSDPLRLKILRLFCEEPRTTKQVATLLGEKPTRLYHHVDGLENAGLITLHHTRPNRGTLEKYYLAVARTFRADSALFHGDEGDTPEWATLGADLLDVAAGELRRLEPQGKTEEIPAVLAQLSIKATAGQIEEIQERLEKWIGALSDLEEEDGEEDGEIEEYRLALAFFPAPSDSD